MKAISYDERIRRAQTFLDQARRVSLAGDGPQRGGRLNHKRSLLRQAHNALGRLLAVRPPATATAVQIAEAKRIARLIDDNHGPGDLLAEVRRRKK